MIKNWRVLAMGAALVMAGAVLPVGLSTNVFAADKKEETKKLYSSEEKEGKGSFNSSDDTGHKRAGGTTDTGGICDPGNGISEDLKKAAGCDLTSEDTVTKPAVNLINIVLGLIGLLAVGVMVYGGAQYTTSAGDAAKATKARNIIIYGLVGLIVALMAFAIVNFVSGTIG